MHARQLSYFLSVVEHGGFGRAAAAMGVKQPSLSQSIKTLERDVGAELFRRASHGVVLTAAGRALLGPARQLMRDLAAVRDSVGVTVEPAVLDLVAVAPLGSYPGVDLVVAFRARFPRIQVRLEKAEHHDRLTTLVRDGSCEVGLTYLPAARLDLAAIELGSHELLLAFPPGAPRAPGPVPVAALAGLSLVGPHRGPQSRGVVESGLRAAGVRTRMVVEVAQRDTILDLVAAGVAAAFVVDAAAPSAVARGLAVRPVDPPLRLAYGLIHRLRPLSDPAQAFVDLTIAAATAAGPTGPAPAEA